MHNSMQLRCQTNTDTILNSFYLIFYFAHACNFFVYLNVSKNFKCTIEDIDNKHMIAKKDILKNPVKYNANIFKKN